MIVVICQWCIAFLLVAQFFFNVYRNFYGRTGEHPGGFVGFLGSLLALLSLLAVFYAAGAFSELLPR